MRVLYRGFLRALAFAALALATTPAAAEGDEPTTDALFAAATADLNAGRVDEAISRFETMADRDVHDGAVSFNRGIAYARRASSAASKPGDLGQAACAFAEARALTSDAALGKKIVAAEASTQRELGRKLAAHGGGSTLMEPPAPFGRQLVDLMPPLAWALVAGLGSLLCLVAFVLYLRKRGGSARHALAGTGFFLAGLASLAAYRAQSYRLTEVDACVITENATLFREASFASRGEALREGAHLKILSGHAEDAFVEVRWGSLTGYALPTALRKLARP